MRLATTGFTCIKIHKTEFFTRSNILLVNCACICVTDGQCSMKLLKTCKFEYNVALCFSLLSVGRSFFNGNNTRRSKSSNANYRNRNSNNSINNSSNSNGNSRNKNSTNNSNSNSGNTNNINNKNSTKL